jgi:hypothetical protein
MPSVTVVVIVADTQGVATRAVTILIDDDGDGDTMLRDHSGEPITDHSGEPIEIG